jgi:hypothetical protein
MIKKMIYKNKAHFPSLHKSKSQIKFFHLSNDFLFSGNFYERYD